jgi:hypothetical protein
LNEDEEEMEEEKQKPNGVEEKQRSNAGFDDERFQTCLPQR